MGEAIYTLKATFKDAKKASSGMESLSSMLNCSLAAYVYWQDNRGKDPGEFWPAFKAKYPRVLSLLELAGVKVGGGCNNELAGRLSYTELEEPLNIKQKGTVVIYKAEVWHFAHWGGLARFAVTPEVGAMKAYWSSDEGAGGEAMAANYSSDRASLTDPGVR